MLPEEVTDITTPLPFITSSDHTTGFYGLGNKPWMERVITYPEARELLGQGGDSLQLEDQVKALRRPIFLAERP